MTEGANEDCLRLIVVSADTDPQSGGRSSSSLSDGDGPFRGVEGPLVLVWVCESGVSCVSDSTRATGHHWLCFDGRRRVPTPGLKGLLTLLLGDSLILFACFFF